MDMNKFYNPGIASEREKSIKQEKKLAKINNLRLTKNSGAGSDKADLKGSGLRIEAKRTDKSQIAFKLEWIQKLKRETKAGEIPVIVIEIGGETLYCVFQSEFDFIKQRIEEER